MHVSIRILQRLFLRAEPRLLSQAELRHSIFPSSLIFFQSDIILEIIALARSMIWPLPTPILSLGHEELNKISCAPLASVARLHKAYSHYPNCFVCSICQAKGRDTERSERTIASINSPDTSESLLICETSPNLFRN